MTAVHPKLTQPAVFKSPEQPVPADTVGDERFAKRKLTQLPALVGHRAISNWIAGTIIDASSTGARLQVKRSSLTDARHLDRFANDLTLTIPSERSSVTCRLVWRENDLLGLEYTGHVHQIARPTKKEPRVQQSAGGLMGAFLKRNRVKPI